MKRVLILAGLFIMCFHLVSAQTSKGSMMLGGSVSFSNQTYDYGNNPQSKSSSFSFSPSFGYFLADNMVIGANLGITTQASSQGESRSDYFGFSGGPMFRWYKATSNEKFSFFAQASLSFAKSDRTETNGFMETEYSAASVGLNISPGFAYFFNNHWSAELSLSGIGYSRHENESPNGESVTTNFQFGVDSFAPWLGVRYYF